MITVRQVERLWNAQNFPQLLGQILVGRPEASPRLQQELAGAVAAAAMVMIRLDELAQSHVPLYDRLLRILLGAQDADGGWGEPLTSAVCLRALMCSRGQGLAIDGGLLYLAQLQKSEGIWPKAPLRRLAADPYVSALILLQLGSDERFRRAVQFADAVNWFRVHAHTLDADTLRLWQHAAVRCRMFHSPDPVLSWS